MFKRKKEIEELKSAMYQLEQRFKGLESRHTTFVMDINTQISLHRQSLTGLSERVNDELKEIYSRLPNSVSVVDIRDLIEKDHKSKKK